MADSVDLVVRAKQEGFPETKAAVEDLNASVTKANVSTEAAGAAALTGEAGLAAFEKELHSAATAGQAAAVGTTAAAGGVTLLSRALAALAGPLGILITILVTLLTNLKEVGDWFGRLGEKMDTWIHGVGQGTPVLDEHGKKIDELAVGYNKAATAADLHTRALKSVELGLIPATENTALLDARQSLLEQTFRKSSTSTDAFGEAVKALGFKTVASFDDMKAHGNDFLKIYDDLMRDKGPEAARLFAEANKASLDAVVSRYVLMGAEIPARLKLIETGLGSLSAAEIEAAKDKGLAARYEHDLQKIGADTATLLQKVANLGDEFLKTRDKIEASAQAEIAANSAKTASTLAGLQDEIAKTEAAHAARSISDTDYNTKINTLIAQEAKARTDGFDHEKSILDDEKAALDKNVADRDAAGKAMVAKLDELAEKQGEVTEKFTLLTAKIAAQQEATDLASIGFVGLSRQFGTTSSEATVLGGVVSTLTQHVRDLEAAARGAAAALATITEGNSGGGPLPGAGSATAQ